MRRQRAVSRFANFRCGKRLRGWHASRTSNRSPRVAACPRSRRPPHAARTRSTGGAMRVSIVLDGREVYSAELRPIKRSSTGKSVILAQDSSKHSGIGTAFEKLGWSFTLYGVDKQAAEAGAQ